MKSVPEPERINAQVGTLPNFLAVVGDLALAICESCARCHTVIFVSGSSISRATPLMNCSSVCEPAIRNSPRSLPSVLM